MNSPQPKPSPISNRAQAGAEAQSNAISGDPGTKSKQVSRVPQTKQFNQLRRVIHADADKQE